MQSYATKVALILDYSLNLLVARVLLRNVAFATAIPDLISRVHLASFVIMLPK
jgi:hypothetical protein